MKHGIRTDYHTYMHIPDEVREALGRLGLDVKRLEEEDQLRVIDSYTITTGLGFPESSDKGREQFRNRSLDLKDWINHYLVEVKEGVPEAEKRRLHLDDNTSVLVQYNSEKTYLDSWRTNGIPWTRKSETANFQSMILGAFSETLYSKLEPMMDGIIDFRSREESGRIEHYVRVRTMRGQTPDSRWRHLRLSENGEVIVEPVSEKGGQLGIRGWLKRPRK